MVVSENLAPVARPDVFPDILGVSADTVDKPLRIVVQGDLGLSVPMLK